MTMNKTLLQQVLAKIEADPKSWNQSYWFCGTAACFAGHVCILSGDKPVFEEFEDENGDWVEDDRSAVISVAGGGDRKDADDRAQELLGLTHDQALSLFSSENTLDDLRAIVHGLVECDEVPAQYQDR
jgi:hypothetical protein